MSLARGLEWELPEDKNFPKPAGHGLIDGSGKAIPIAIQKSLEKDQQNRTSREGEAFLLVKYLKRSAKEKNTFHMQANVFPKKNFGTWLDAQMKLVRVDPLL